MTGVVVAVLGLTGVAIGVLANGYLDRKRLFAEQLAIAFDRFKESQRRSAGIASLDGLRTSSPRFWAPHSGAVQTFLHAQALYLLLHASNRRRAHEIANLRILLVWILPEDDTPLAVWQLQDLNTAMRRYVDEGRGASGTPESAEANSPTVDSFCRDLEATFIPRTATRDGAG